ncbi:MAG: SdrD B-like domain-containing protein, partial [Ignavibacteriaceae bacterium]
LTFQGTPNPLGGSFSINAVNGNVLIAWANLTALNTGNGKLLDLNFSHISGNSNLEFIIQSCEIANALASPLPVTYQNGKVNCVPPSSGKASIGDKVWIDINKNGIQDIGEQGLEWVTVELYDCNDNWKAWTSTNANGEYSFTDLEPGDYYVKFYLIDDNSIYTFTTKDAGSDNEKDSDVSAINDSVGRTACTSLIAGENDLSWDLGVYAGDPPSNNYGSIGNFAWKDINCNGVQDDGEPGLANVTVKLTDCDFNVLKTAITNSSGFYLFDKLAAGVYCVQFVLPSGYQFTAKDAGGDDNKDSDPDNIHGRVDCFTLAEGENNLSIDAGFCKIVDPGNPELSLTKSDGRLTMPDVDKTTTYTIIYKNNGDGDLLNAVIKDTLPQGVKFIAASDGGSETSSGSNIVVFNLGTLKAGEDGSVTVKVKVTEYESEYLNTACLSGKDADDNWYTECAEDRNFCDTTSSGGGSGVESRGDMAELLLRREWKIRHGLTTRVLLKSGAASISSQFDLQELTPAVGPYNSSPVETTPFDILGISNAVASYAVDYKMATGEGNRRIAGIFSTITTAPNIYDHTKAVCDRLAGSAIEEIKLVDVNGYKFYAAKLRKSSGRITDYAISFSVYETPSGYLVENKWTWEEYKAPAGASSVYNFQAWSSTYEASVELVKNIIANLETRGTVSYMNNSQNVPDVFIKSTRYTHDGKVHLTFVNNSGSARQVNLTSYLRFSQGDELIGSASSHIVKAGESEVSLAIGIVADAQVHLSQQSGFEDEVFVSGGAYTHIAGTNSSVTEFKTNGYQQQNIAAYPEGSVLLSGGVYASGRLGDWMTVVRALTTNGSSYDLKDHGQVKFEAGGTGVLTVFFDMANVSGFNYFAKNITLSAQSQEYVLNLSDFRQLYGSEVQFDASQMRGVGFILNTANNPGLNNFNFEIKNIVFLPSKTTSAGSESQIPTEFALGQNYPNPFNPSTTIEFSVANKEMISLRIYDMLGQQVAELINGELEVGKHSVNFDAGMLSSGVYFYKLQGNSVNITKKMTFAK